MLVVPTILVGGACGQSPDEERPADVSHKRSPGNFDLAFVRAEAPSGPGSPLDSVIYLTTIDGRGPVALAASAADLDTVDEQPSFSPDGQRITFVRSADRGKANEDIYVTDANGSKAVNLTNSPDSVETSPAFSPDGKHIAFVSDRGGGGIYIMETDGSNVRRVIGSDSPPSYSPGGMELLFADTSDGDGEGLDIFRVRVDGSDKENVLDDPSIWAEWPRFSPDGERIAFLRAKPRDPLREVWLMRADGSKARSVFEQAGPSNVSFSPTGGRIAFVSAGDKPGISVGRVNGQDVSHIRGTGVADSSPAWSPSPPFD